MRKAVALFVTLGILSLISLMIMNSFDLMTKSFKHIENVEKLNQTKVVINDIEKVLSAITKEIKDPETLELLVGAYPPISDEDGLFSLAFELEIMSKAININLIMEDFNKTTPNRVLKVKEKYMPIFEYIFNTYRIRDGEFFLQLLLDTLDTDSIARNLDTEIVLNDINFLNGLIVNRSQFNQIISEYQAKSDDKEILQVPWEDFFYFSYNKDNTIIDCNFMSRNLAYSIGLDIYENQDSEAVELSSDSDIGEIPLSCEMLESDDNIEKMKIYNMAEFNTTKNYFLKGSVYYSTNSVSDSFKFIYNLKAKRIVDIEVQDSEN